MNIKDIEYLWKRASNNPHHDTNWHDPVVIAFAESVAAHTLMNIDPSKFMSYQEAFEAGRFAEREACAKVCLTEWSTLGQMEAGEAFARAIRNRGKP